MPDLVDMTPRGLVKEYIRAAKQYREADAVLAAINPLTSTDIELMNAVRTMIMASRNMSVISARLSDIAGISRHGDY